uniref:Uncharacterized protein n=1 Tax=Rhizophora mucronata TaxID=61149 RepID=A0A2P2L7I3_RHIMU
MKLLFNLRKKKKLLFWRLDKKRKKPRTKRKSWKECLRKT